MIAVNSVINLSFFYYLSLTVNISKTVADTAKVTIND